MMQQGPHLGLLREAVLIRMSLLQDFYMQAILILKSVNAGILLITPSGNLFQGLTDHENIRGKPKPALHLPLKSGKAITTNTLLEPSHARDAKMYPKHQKFTHEVISDRPVIAVLRSGALIIGGTMTASIPH